ncbi:MAG TPA: hypothetical protein VKR30_09770 [Candidatus Limnocylindrales bacterium]|nr:hypothetical protein [Candidatus Limnocylindrales bacterium]
MNELRIEAGLAASLPDLAAGRTLVIDHFASRRCGATIGDLRVSWAGATPAELVDIGPLAGVPTAAEPALVDLLASGATLRRSRASRAGVRVDLDLPERWLDFLDEHPASRR